MSTNDGQGATPKGWLGSNSIELCEAQVSAILQEWLEREHGIACRVTGIESSKDYSGHSFTLKLGQREEGAA